MWKQSTPLKQTRNSDRSFLCVSAQNWGYFSFPNHTLDRNDDDRNLYGYNYFTVMCDNKDENKVLVFSVCLFLCICASVGWYGRSEWVMAARRCRSRVLSRVWSIWRQINSPINNLELYQYLSWGKRYQKMITFGIQSSPCIPPRPKLKKKHLPNIIFAREMRLKYTSLKILPPHV